MNNSERWNGELPDLYPPIIPLLKKEPPVIEKGVVHRYPDGSINFITIPTSDRRPIQIGKGEKLKKMSKKISPIISSILKDIK